MAGFGGPYRIGNQQSTQGFSWGDYVTASNTPVSSRVTNPVKPISTQGFSWTDSGSGSDYVRAGLVTDTAGSGGGGSQFAGGGGAPADPPGPALTYNKNELVYNVGCVDEAYFSKRPSFHQELTPNATGSINDNPTTITKMDELWTKAGTNKGMISLFIPSTPNTGIDGVVPSADSKLQPAKHNRYGFQFHYNPEKISMDYSGAPNTDVGMEISGQEGFNLVGAQVNQSTISFDIILNRVADMKYYENTGLIKSAYSGKTIYSPKNPSVAEQKEIYNKGTMYDIEYLLSTVIGYRINTKFRGVTADVGWLSGRPVELYLGKSLRYLGFINAFSIKHQIFNERMVPVFTTASLNFNRIPDYSGL